MSSSAEAPRARALRILLVANDGFSTGHVTRMVATSRGLARRAKARGIDLRLILATTSEAHTLLADEPLLVVHLPAPLAARRAGFDDRERRRIVRGTLAGLADSFAPDLLVVDTFPSGPHGELDGLCVGRAKRALVRRSVPEEGDETLTAGLRDFDLAIVAADPGTVEPRLPIRVVHVPPITLFEAKDALSRASARAELDLPALGQVVLVASGGGGDTDAAMRALSIARAVTRLSPDTTAVLARGPLAPEDHGSIGEPRLRVMRRAKLQPLLAAFDGAFAAAGYNTAHELAKAGIPAALFAQPRPFDDQAARIVRFEQAALAHALRAFDDVAIAEALAWMLEAPRPSLAAGGADRAAEALLALVTGEVAP